MRLIVRYFLRITLFAMLVVGWGCSADFEPMGDASPNPDDSYWGDYITALGWIEEAEDLNREMCAITTDEGVMDAIESLGERLETMSDMNALQSDLDAIIKKINGVSA
mgnify:CR=1 FL=1